MPAEAADVALAKRLELRARTGIEHAPMNSAVAGVLADLETPMTESDIAMLTETIKWHGLETVDPAKRLAQAEIEDRTTAAQLAVREAAHQEHLASSRPRSTPPRRSCAPTRHVPYRLTNLHRPFNKAAAG